MSVFLSTAYPFPLSLRALRPYARGGWLEHLSTGCHWIGSIPRGTGPLDRLALPHWSVHWGGGITTWYRIEVHAAQAVSSPLSPTVMAVSRSSRMFSLSDALSSAELALSPVPPNPPLLEPPLMPPRRPSPPARARSRPDRRSPPRRPPRTAAAEIATATAATALQRAATAAAAAGG